MFNVWLAGDHLDGKWLFTWLSLVMSLMMSYFVLSFFPRDVLAEIWDWIEPAHENFLPTFADLGPVVQSIVSLTSSLRGQLVKCFTTL